MVTSWWGCSPGNRGTRRILVGKANAKQKKHKKKKIVYRDQLTVEWTQLVEETLIVGTVVKSGSVALQMGKGNRNPTVVVKENTI